MPVEQMSIREKLSWRQQLYVRKARGGIPELSWTELLQMTRHGDGSGLLWVATEGRGLEGAVKNPYVSENDQQVGSGIFREQCAVCHGSDGGGGPHAPGLNRNGLQHGDSDFAIYRALRDGIPGTAMMPARLTTTERWQLVWHIRTLQIRGLGWPTDTPRAVNISVGIEDFRRREPGQTTG